MNAFAGAADADRREADQERQRRDDFEINERLDSEAPNFFEIRVAGDSDDESPEEQRRDDNFDQPQENRAKQLQMRRRAWTIVAKFSTSK